MRTRYLDIDDRTEDLAQRIREEPTVAEDFLRKYELSWIYHENALEGVVYTGQELELALAHPMLADASVLDAHQEIRNHRTAFEVVRTEAKQKKLKFTLVLVKKLYETLGIGLEDREVAEFRKDIPLHRAYFHDIAQPAKIPFLLGKLLDLTESTDFKNMHPIEQASKLQHGFMQVYPFTENSGKVARLLANIILINQSYLPCIIHAIDRQRYYESLRLPEPQLRELMVDAIENALDNGERFFEMAEQERKKQLQLVR
jgi:Fic family protein